MTNTEVKQQNSTLNNNKGHLKNNIVPCCYKCNTIKNNFFTFEEMKKIGKFLNEEIYKK